MSAGLPQDDPWADRQLADTEQQLSNLMNDGLTFSNPPGVKYEYSNFGFAILGRIVTNVSGVLYQTYVKENILKPLGMTSSTFDINEVDLKRYAMGYRRENNQWVEEAPLADGSFASIGGLFLTFFTYTGEAALASGNTYTLFSIAAVVLGGVSLFGGRGSAIGAVFGALAFLTIKDLMFVLNVDPLWQPLLQGVVLLLAVSIGSARLFQVRNRLELFG
jgi:CubicO group peptidase (beta-lactamase class C family)